MPGIYEHHAPALSWERVGLLADTVGEPGFGLALMETLDEAVSADDCMAMLCHFGRCGGMQSGGVIHAVRTRGTLERLIEQSKRADRHFDLRMARYEQNFADRRRRISMDRVMSNAADVGCYRMIIDEIQTEAFRREFYYEGDIVDHVYALRPNGDSFVALSVFRCSKNGRFLPEQLGVFAQLAPMLLSFVARHQALSDGKTHRTPAINFDVSRTLAAMGAGLTSREIDVCSRMLGGVMTLGIALDLGISLHTVRTYRRRAYAKLNITSMPELFSLVLAARKRLSAGPDFAKATPDYAAMHVSAPPARMGQAARAEPCLAAC